MLDLTITTLDQRPHLVAQIDALSRQSWPEFLLHGDVRHWRELLDTFPEYQLLLLGPDDRLLAVGHTVPLVWDGRPETLPMRIEDILLKALEIHRKGTAPDTLSAMAAMVSLEVRGQGLSTQMVQAMKALAKTCGCRALIAPVRPTMKSLYPLTSLERYAAWVRPDGLPLDPWLRVHVRLGGRILKIAPATVTVSGTVGEWESWTGLTFPDSGPYVIPGALQPVLMKVAADQGRYDDPNVWILHPILLP